MSKHTPLPWNIGGGRYLPITAEVNGKRAQIGRLESFGQISSEEVEANADFVLRAVHSHYEFLEACKKALAHLEAQMKYITDDRMALGHNEDARQLLQAAVAQAEGETP